MKSDPSFTQYVVSILLGAHDSKISNSALEPGSCPAVCFCGAGRDPHSLMVKPPAQTGFPKEVLGQGSSSGCWLCHLGSLAAPPPKSRGRRRRGCCRGTLFPTAPRASHFPFIFGNSKNLWVHWMASQGFSSAYLLHGDSLLGLQRLSLQLYVPEVWLPSCMLFHWMQSPLEGLQPLQSYSECAEAPLFPKLPCSGPSFLRIHDFCGMPHESLLISQLNISNVYLRTDFMKSLLFQCSSGNTHFSYAPRLKVSIM